MTDPLDVSHLHRRCDPDFTEIEANRCAQVHVPVARNASPATLEAVPAAPREGSFSDVVAVLMYLSNRWSEVWQEGAAKAAILEANDRYRMRGVRHG